MTFFKRFLVLFISGAVQVFFATYLLLELLGLSLGWHLAYHNIMFVPGILIFLGSGYLTVSYYFLVTKKPIILYTMNLLLSDITSLVLQDMQLMELAFLYFTQFRIGLIGTSN